MAAYRATGRLAPKPEGGWRSSKLDPHRDVLIRRVTRRATSPGRNAPLTWRPEDHARVDRALVHPPGRQLQQTLRASEQGRSALRQARDPWRTTRQPRMRQEPHRRVFLDETVTSTRMTRLRGRRPRGPRLYAKAPFGHGLTQTFLAGLRCSGLPAPGAIDGPPGASSRPMGSLNVLRPCLTATW
jgi:hypothetical protein